MRERRRARGLVLPWRAVVGLIVVVIFFIPIKRYTLPGSLPFDLEPYRVVVALCVGCWATSKHRRLTRSQFDSTSIPPQLATRISLPSRVDFTAQ